MKRYPAADGQTAPQSAVDQPRLSKKDQTIASAMQSQRRRRLEKSEEGCVGFAPTNRTKVTNVEEGNESKPSPKKFFIARLH